MTFQLSKVIYIVPQSPSQDEEEIYRGLEDLVTEDQYTDFYQKHLGGGNFGRRSHQGNIWVSSTEGFLCLWLSSYLY